MPNALHHVELWSADPAAAEHEWEWLLTTIGWRDGLNHLALNAGGVEVVAS